MIKLFNIFLRLNIQRTLDKGCLKAEGVVGAIAKKVITFQRTMTIKGPQFFEGKTG